MPERLLEKICQIPMPDRTPEYKPERMSDTVSDHNRLRFPDGMSETFRNYVRIVCQGGDHPNKVMFNNCPTSSPETAEQELNRDPTSAMPGAMLP